MSFSPIRIGSVASAARRKGTVSGGGGAISALRFPSNVDGADKLAPYSVIEYASPQTNGLPPLGPGNVGITFIWRTKYRPQQGYHVNFWYGRADGNIDPPSANGNFYMGCHPYPQTSSNAGFTHWWEIAGEAGDFRNNQNGSMIAVVKDTYFYQAMRVTNSGGSAVIMFWTDLTNVSNNTRITATLSSAYVASVHASTKITFGDSPWYPNYQHERHGGSVAEFLVVARAMSEADIVTQAQNMQALTAPSSADLWYYKKTWPTINSLTCDGGTGRSFTRNDSSNLLSVEAAP